MTPSLHRSSWRACPSERRAHSACTQHEHAISTSMQSAQEQLARLLVRCQACESACNQHAISTSMQSVGAPGRPLPSVRVRPPRASSPQ
jgi:MinD superfamily P-loop ATPase